MMVGEIRDLETAQIAVQAALTGHLVLSTLHTNDAASAITRLLDMGVEPVPAHLDAQRGPGAAAGAPAVPDCREEYVPSEATLAAMGVTLPEATALYRPRGCAACAGTGFRGRLAVLELLVPNEEIIRLVLGRAEAREIARAAGAASMRTMFEDGLAKAAAGLTTLDEVLRVTREG